jgi:hypothetical protein
VLPLSVLTLALLGGFVFVNLCYLTRFTAIQSTGYRLVFSSAVAGVGFLFFATILIPWLLVLPGGQYVSDSWAKLIRLEHSGRPVVAFLIGVILWMPFNLLGWLNPPVLGWRPFRFLSEGAAIKREIRKKQNPLEVLLSEAMVSKRLVAVTVKNGKVYIGKVLTTSNPAFGMEAINLQLSRSGYRDKNTQEMRLTVNYDDTHGAIRQEMRMKIGAQFVDALRKDPHADEGELLEETKRKVSAETDIRNYEIAIPISEIQSANVFDLDVYETYFAPKTGRPKTMKRR